jgi:hypothetical protein
MRLGQNLEEANFAKWQLEVPWTTQRMLKI